MSEVKYCVKCFDDNDETAVSIVCSIDELFDIIGHFSKVYKVKAFILNNDKEV